MSLKNAKIERKPLTLQGVTVGDNSLDAYSVEEEILSRMAAKNPLVLDLIERFNLVSERTGEELRLIPGEPPALIEEPPSPGPERGGEAARPKRSIDGIAAAILEPEINYSREEIILRLIEREGIDRGRAEAGFSAMVGAGAILEAGAGRYYLRGSTPF